MNYVDETARARRRAYDILIKAGYTLVKSTTFKKDFPPFRDYVPPPHSEIQAMAYLQSQGWTYVGPDADQVKEVYRSRYFGDGATWCYMIDSEDGI